MKASALDIPGVLLFEPAAFADERGYFMESFQAERYRDAGLIQPFVQDNLSKSRHGVLRGLHFQYPRGQGKLVQVFQGEVFDVAVDIRRGSPSFGHWVGAILSSENRYQLWIPPGFAHGFCVLSGEALLTYKCTDYYSPATEQTIRWDDPSIRVEWPLSQPSLSAKDRSGDYLRDIAPSRLPVYTERDT